MTIEHAIIIAMSGGFWGASALAITYHCRWRKAQRETATARKALLRAVERYAARNEGFAPETEDGPLTQREPMRAAS